MDEGNTTDSNTANGTNAANSLSGEPDSPFTPRPAEKPLELPDTSNPDQLRLATSAIVQQGISLSAAAKKYDVNPDTLFIWHRTYINFIGKDVIAANNFGAPRERVDFDRQTSRKFDKNWAEMLRIWELERPQLSPLHKRLLASPFTRWMFRDEQIDKVTVAGAVAVIAFTGLAIRGGTNYLGKNPDPADQNNATADVIDPSNPDSYKSEDQTATLAKVSEALQKFAKLESWQERLPFVRTPEIVKPLMVDYYKSHPDGQLDQLTLDREVTFIQRDQNVFIYLQGQFTPKDSELGETRHIIFLVETQEAEPNFLFDWEVMVNYEPVPWEKFIASKSTRPEKFRLRVALGDYYNQPFMDPEKYTCYVLFPLHRDERVYGFVERNTPLARTLEENLAKELNQNRAMILNLKFPAKAKFNNILQIESIVSDGWLQE